jgi:hypothetical protein
VPNPQQPQQPKTDAAAPAPLFDHTVTIAKGVVDTWAAMARGFAANEPFGTVTEIWAGIFTAYFDWAKLLQTIPEVGGSGRREVKRGASPVVASWVVPNAVSGPLHAGAWMNGDGLPFRGTITADPAPVKDAPTSTTITVTLTPPTGTPSGRYGGSILDRDYSVVLGPVTVSIPSG